MYCDFYGCKNNCFQIKYSDMFVFGFLCVFAIVILLITFTNKYCFNIFVLSLKTDIKPVLIIAFASCANKIR